jgi:hypothetical protein
MSKIIIFGFPHCGTTILKSIIGHIEDVEEIIDETKQINKMTNKKFILCKNPFTISDFFTNKYDNYIKIFIIRNPLYVYSSLNKRFNYKIPNNESINCYLDTIEKFVNNNNNNNKLFKIKYEELFDINYQKLKDIFDTIGLNYTDKIFDNNFFNNKTKNNININNITTKPNNTDHVKYRTWQINQPFINNNDPSKLDLTEDQKKQFINNKLILSLYPDIPEILLKH